MACSLQNLATCAPAATPAPTSLSNKLSALLTVPLSRFGSPCARRNVKKLSAGVSASRNGNDVIQVDRKEQRSPSTQRRRDDSGLSLADAWDAVSVGNLTRMMDRMDRLFDTTFNSSMPGAMRRGIRSPWDVVEDEQSFYLRVDMPGFAKEDIKVSVEDQILIIQAEKQAEEKEDRWASQSLSKFETRVALPDSVVLEEIKAEVKNGVLSVSVPKVKGEGKKSVINVAIS